LALTSAGFPRTDAFAGAGLEVLATAYYDSEYVGVIIERDGRMSLRHESGDDEKFYREGMTMAEVKQKIDEIAGQIWSSSDSSIRETLTGRGTGSTISRSKTSMVASRSSTRNASTAFHLLSATM
jgi:hypothetical protein